MIDDDILVAADFLEEAGFDDVVAWMRDFVRHGAVIKDRASIEIGGKPVLMDIQNVNVQQDYASRGFRVHVAGFVPEKRIQSLPSRAARPRMQGAVEDMEFMVFPR